MKVYGRGYSLKLINTYSRLTKITNKIMINQLVPLCFEYFFLYKYVRVRTRVLVSKEIMTYLIK